MDYIVLNVGIWETQKLTLSCRATNGNWKFCRWGKTGIVGGYCTYKFFYQEDGNKWTQTTLENTKNHTFCGPAFDEFNLIVHEIPISKVDGSNVGLTNRCEIEKMRSEIKDAGEYTCEMLQCNEPQNGGCKNATRMFGRVEIEKMTVQYRYLETLLDLEMTIV